MKPGEKRDMAVVFYVDPKLAEDSEQNGVNLITLSYTFFEAKTERAKILLGGNPANGTGKGG